MSRSLRILLTTFLISTGLASCSLLQQLNNASQSKQDTTIADQKVYSEGTTDCNGDALRFDHVVFPADQIKVFKDIPYVTFDPSLQWNNGEVSPPCFGKKPFTFPTGDGQVEMRMDIYMPDAEIDPCTDRPVVIYLYPGGYSPVNTPSRQDNIYKTHATHIAQLGYVVAIMDYRKGFDTWGLEFHPDSRSAHFGKQTCMEGDKPDSKSFERSLFRMVQDVKAAHRFLHANRDKLRIDPYLTFYAGGSTGALGAAHAAYAGENSDWAFLGMGKLEDFGPNPELADELHVAGVWAQQPALHRIEWLEASDNIPIYMLHGNKDLDVPFGEGYMGSMSSYLGRTDLLPDFKLYGSGAMYQKVTQMPASSGTKAGLMVFDNNDHYQGSIALGQCGDISDLIRGQWSQAYSFGRSIISHHRAGKGVALENSLCTWYQPTKASCKLSCE